MSVEQAAVVPIDLRDYARILLLCELTGMQEAAQAQPQPCVLEVEAIYPEIGRCYRGMVRAEISLMRDALAFTMEPYMEKEGRGPWARAGSMAGFLFDPELVSKVEIEADGALAVHCPGDDENGAYLLLFSQSDGSSYPTEPALLAEDPRDWP